MFTGGLCVGQRWLAKRCSPSAKVARGCTLGPCTAPPVYEVWGRHAPFQLEPNSRLCAARCLQHVNSSMLAPCSLLKFD